MKIKQTESLYATLSKLAEKELPFSLSYKIAKIIEKIESDYKFYAEKLKKIAEKYGEKSESGDFIIDDKGNVKIQPEFQSLAETEVAELQNIELEEFTTYLSKEELSNLSFSPSDIYALLPIIKD